MSEQDVTAAKVFMRTFNDALICARDIAETEAARAHYKDYVRHLVMAIRKDHLMLDRSGEVVSALDPAAANIYKIMKFSEGVTNRYGLAYENIQSSEDLN